MTFNEEYDTYGKYKERSHDDELSDDEDMTPTDYYTLKEYYEGNINIEYYTYSKKSAIALISYEENLRQGVIIQRGNKFYVFLNNPDLERFEEDSLVNEIIPKERLRYPTVDIDSKVPSLDDLINYFSGLIDDPYDLYIFETTSGYHALVKSITADFETHKEFIKKVAEDNPGWKVDERAGLHGIKVIGTRSMKAGGECKRLIYPCDGDINETLSCPIEIQPTREKLFDDYKVGGNDILDEDILDEDMKKISMALTNEENNLIGVSNECNGMISYNRVSGSYCNICNRRHGYNNFYGYIEPKCIDAWVVPYSDCFIVGCFRSPGKKIILTREEDSDNEITSEDIK